MSRKVGILLFRSNADRLAAFLEAWHRLMQIVRTTPPPSAPPPSRPPTGTGHMQTRVEHERIWTPEGLAPRDLSAAIMDAFPYDVWTDAARVSYHESGWRFDAELNTLDRGGGRCGVRYWFSDEVGWATTEQSVGYFQINVCAHGHDRAYWQNARNNVNKAGALFASEGWSPWRVTARRLGLQ